MIAADAEYDVFEKLNLDCTCELMFLATLPEWERKGIGRALTQYTIELTRELKSGDAAFREMNPTLQSRRPMAVTALWTSMFSQKLGKDLGFQVLTTIPYTRFSYAGKTYEQRLGPPHSTCQHVIYLL